MAMNSGRCCYVELLVAIVAVLLMVTCQPVESGCMDYKLSNRVCCSGKNVSCKAYGPRMNDIDTRKRSRTCFCDEYCVGIKDCCTDYHQACRREYNIFIIIILLSYCAHPLPITGQFDPF